ncbi:MAG: cyclic beta 1-2 glucan synthetase, partial [Betaproteobacteria bacterium HGW-Betaproteobacteria-21]
GEWLLDNFYLIDEQIRTAKRHLPSGYSRELPRLERGPSAGRPRVYDIALETIAHGDGRVDTDSLSRFVAAYQSVSSLKLGELWAIPIMLRLAVIENLRRVSARISQDWAEHTLAAQWADQMISAAETDPKSLILVVADMARSGPPMSTAFVAELARKLQGRGSALALPLTWIEQRLSESGQTIEQLVLLENQQQAADQVSISNSIGSLRVLGAMDWREFVETMSEVEQTLRGDPGGVYGRMEFATRDRYRHATEEIARRSRLSEGEVARQVVALAHAGAAAAAGGGADAREAHVGYYLIDKGERQLERIVRPRRSALESMRGAAARWSLPLYLGAIALIVSVIGLSLLAWTGPLRWPSGTPGWVMLPVGILISGIALLAASQLAVALVNWLATVLVRPHSLPRMDFSRGIPTQLRTLVVVPTMLTGADDIESLVEALEVRFLANRDESLHFGLLTDFLDAAQATLPEDAALEQLARTRIEALNRKYADGTRQGSGDIFFLFHRARSWNPQERVWMGYERKRGKLADLNALLRGRAPGQAGGGFDLVVGDTAILSNVKYVITLDTDTQLPRDVARQFVGAMAHPLNRPRYDAGRLRVVEGYGILQPRVAVSLPGSNRSRYARLYGGEPGLDPYTRAVSDVYQDVFGEGSFIGKGIYDVDAFEQALGERFPENRILSHDLIEGCFARSGLLSDVQLFEDYPARYSADVSRRQRWMRGDWQLGGWILPWVPCGCGPSAGAKREHRQSNPLSALSQWKLIDNLRRSLVPVALTLLLVLGWTLLGQPWLWTLVVIAILLLPALFAAMLELVRKPDEISPMQHLGTVGHSVSRQLAQLVFEIACLPYEAFLSLDAIARTLWRMCVSRRRLLEWSPSSEIERKLARRSDLSAALRSMWAGPATAIVVTIFLLLVSTTVGPSALTVALPILLLWLGSPLIAWWISRPLPRREAHLTPLQTRFLRALARRTWGFFETHVGAADHWLPPDNSQAYRVVSVAHRTSPTNIGMALLANLAAYDFGYIGGGVLLTRTANTLRTMDGLARHRGHFYNWYDTETLDPLPPLYVSTVDSGNLAGHLLTLSAGLLALADDAVASPRLFQGLADTLDAVEDAMAPGGAAADPLLALRSDLDAVLAAPPASLTAVHATLLRLESRAAALPGIVDRVLTRDDTASDSDAAFWAAALTRQCRELLTELELLAPWLLLSPVPGGLEALVGCPSLRTLATLDEALVPEIGRRLDAAASNAQRDGLDAFGAQLAVGSQRARARIAQIEALAVHACELSCMEYDFLYDKGRHLLVIGYNVSEGRADASYYDLLASEARLSSFVAIAQGQVPQENWFALGRLLTRVGGEPALLSWSGSMFEYLMPLLVMPTYDNTLLDQTCKAAVARQIEYGRQRGVPWGISESGYNTVDVHLNYQYRAFGVPGLGLKRGLADDLVIAPYASVMALMVAPEEACRNLQRLAAEGFSGRFGFHEAIDYTPARQRRGQSRVVVRSFMAHHQGMSLLALAYLLLDRPMQARFESDPRFQAVMLLLQERVPKAGALFSQTVQRFAEHSTADTTEMLIRVFDSPDTATPEVQLLSNGRYNVMLTNAGGGYSRWRDLALTRWREDGTCDNRGTFCYVRDLHSGAYWSTAHQPTLRRAQLYEAIFSEGRAEFRRRDAIGTGAGAGLIETYTEIVVSPEDDIELRRVRITNRSGQRREIELTSYAEVVIAPADADALHPAFSNLFVQTEILPARRAILCMRRPRSASERSPWMLHLMAVHGAEAGEMSYETDRARFIGRTRSVAAPAAMHEAGMLSGSAGPVLDPIVAIRCPVSLDPEQSVTIDIVSGIARTRDEALCLIDKYQDRHLADRVFDLAWTHGQVMLRQLNATEADAQLYARLASSVIHANASLRPDPALLIRNRRSQSGLWGYAISGDLPIVLLQIANFANVDLVRQLVQAHAYWRLKGLAVDLVIWNEDHAGYRQRLQDQIMGMITSGIEAGVVDRPGGIFVRPAEQIPSEDRILLQSVARVVITDARGSLEEQLDHRRLAEPRPPQFVASRPMARESAMALAPDPQPLILANGLGGFTPDGREYVIGLAPGAVTPAPWSNVLANPSFGTVISESGVAYTWSENAHEFRLTPWHNDPVSDAGG